ncbi:MAG: hypothetical protein O8C67_06080 [Candidatus Methanoperedens sp.]|nr:hypothetical protein [Candidatus Methanoperedens sp.]
MAAANAVTSTTGVVVSTVVTFKTRNTQKHVFLYVDYTKGNGTSVTMTLGSINPSIHATSLFEHAEFATATIAPITATFSATAAKYRFKIPVSPGESKFVATFAFTGGDTQIVICDLYPD